MKPSARLYHCARCHCQVVICRHCDNGNVYCQSCAKTARQESLRRAGRKYQSTCAGRCVYSWRSNRVFLNREIDCSGVDYLIHGVDEIIQGLNTLIGEINVLDVSALKNKNKRNALTNKINAALVKIDQGEYQDALDKLENDILGKTDG